MSVFRGSITEYPGVIVDHFVSSNCDRGRAFFLSHCHKDHMTGLSSPALFDVLQRRQSSLYCSEVTQSLLLKDPEFSSLSPHLKPLPMEYPVAMALEGLHDLPPLSFTVTLLPAGHCPGSVMFLFQGSSGNVLYTGDFRLTLAETQRLKPLHSNGSLIALATVYLDTTFCHPVASKLPSRIVSRDRVIEIMEKWLSSSESNVVRLHCSAFGYEHIFMGVASKLKTKVHIARWKIQAYADLPAVRDCLTADGGSTRVHNCNFRRGATSRRGMLPCGSVPVKGTPQILHIKPSTIWFLSNSHSLSEPSVFFPEYNSHRVLHSMHASYTEICEFISYLRPRRVVPCVVPVGDSALTDVHSRLKVLLPHSHISTNIILKSSEDTLTASTSRQAGKNSSHSKISISSLVEELDYNEDSSDSDERPPITFTPFASSSSTSHRPPLSTSASGGEKAAFLPAMVASQSSRGGVIAAPACVVAAAASQMMGSSDEGTFVSVSSLEQTSLELSLDGSESSQGTGIVAGVDTGEGVTVLSNVSVNGVPVSEETEKLEIISTTSQTVKTSQTMNGISESRPDKAPPSKRAKVSNATTNRNDPTPSTKPTPRRLFHEDSKSEQPVQYIDLTLDDSPEDDVHMSRTCSEENTADHHIPNRTHLSPNREHLTPNRAQYIPIKDHHHSREPSVVVVSSSDSSQGDPELGGSQDRFSPDILPPTPGREEVKSIFQREKTLSIHF